MLCKKCGTQLNDGLNFCTKCGNKLTNNNPEPVNQSNSIISENVLLEKRVSLVGDLGGNIDGKLIVTTERIIFKKSIFGSIYDENGNSLKELVFPYNEIENITMGKHNLLFTKIVIHHLSGEVYEIAFLSSGKEAVELIEQQFKLKRGS